MITACGSAVYAGSMSKYVIEELCRIPVEADLASDLRYRNPLVDEHTLQLFAYYVAKANGCSIDKPKNLAKSVTVE